MKFLDDLFDALFGAVSRFSRKRAPDLDRSFGRAHVESGITPGLCVYCGKRYVKGAMCPGPSR